MNSSPSDRTLNDLAERVADEVEVYRYSNGFNDLSIVIDNSDRVRSTLIIHIDREQAADLADRVEAFLRNHGARTQRERHADTDISFLPPSNSVSRASRPAWEHPVAHRTKRERLSNHYLVARTT